MTYLLLHNGQPVMPLSKRKLLSKQFSHGMFGIQCRLLSLMDSIKFVFELDACMVSSIQVEIRGLASDTYYEFLVVAYQSTQVIYSPVVTANTANTSSSVRRAVASLIISRSAYPHLPCSAKWFCVHEHELGCCSEFRH